ncbi:hypothetical protein BGZ95_010968 [Linnemannia exigua]|uniref:Uncharacterized protein n=1 Tax=Linnemannia exigua TaxID=604196 RepID=A0AAD4DCL0_9FUNG|nr:hypothetical protein BGZ95_010968 [Linnemannia exigua]
MNKTATTTTAPMANPLVYNPLGTIEVIPTNLWKVNIKQPFPIEGPYYDLAGCLLKPTLKRESSNAPLDLDIELMSPVDSKTPLQVGMSVEAFAPPNEKSVLHSVQRVNVTLSDRNRVIKIKTVMMSDRWEAANSLCITFKFEPIQHVKPRYSWLWNSNMSKDVEDFILEHCPRFMTLVRVAGSSTNNGGEGASALSLTLDPQGLKHDDGHHAFPSPGCTTPTSTTDLPTPQMPMSAAHDKKQPIGQNADLIQSLEDRSDVSSHFSPANSFVDVQHPSFNAPMDDLLMTGFPQSKYSGGVSETDFSDDEGQFLTAPTRAQPSKKHMNRREKREAARKNNLSAEASGTTSPVDAKPSLTDLGQQYREMEFKQEQETKRWAQQKERERKPDSPGLKTSTVSPRLQQQQQHQQLGVASLFCNTTKNGHAFRPGREIWNWTDTIHPDICTFILRWLYLEEVPTCPPSADCGGGVFPFEASEILLTTFLNLNIPQLFQRYLTSQLQCIRQHNDLVSLWSEPALAQRGTLINRFFRPVLLETSYNNIPKIVRSQAFASNFRTTDPSGIIGDLLGRHHSTATRRY